MNTEGCVDVQYVECYGVGQIGPFVSDVESGAVEPDVGFDGDGINTEGAVERHWSPVVVVSVERLGNDSLSQVDRVGVEGFMLDIR